MRLPIFKRTHSLYKRLGELIGFGKIAQTSGVTTDTADDWAREAPSDENPFATGKKNTTDTVLRQIALAHGKNRGLAHDWANTFTAYVKYLDELAGVERAATEANPLCQVIGESASEHLDIVREGLKGDEMDYDVLKSEILQARAKLDELFSCVEAHEKQEIRQQTGFATVGARVN